jgi:hypothetical protein
MAGKQKVQSEFIEKNEHSSTTEVESDLKRPAEITIQNNSLIEEKIQNLTTTKFNKSEEIKCKKTYNVNKVKANKQ